MPSYWVTISGMVETQEDYYIEEAETVEDAEDLACERADDDGLDDVQVVTHREVEN